MSDLKDPNLVMLKPAENKHFSSSIDPMLDPGETIICVYKFMRFSQGVVFTNKRIITIAPQGATSQTAFTALHYSKIQAYSVIPSSGIIPNNTLKLWIPGLGDVELGFASKSDAFAACKIISAHIP